MSSRKKHNPRSPQITKAEKLYKQGNTKEALSCALNALETHPTSKGYILAGKIFRQLQDNKNSFKALEKAIEIEESNHTAWLELSYTYTATGQTAHAILMINKAINLKKGDDSDLRITMESIFNGWAPTNYNQAIHGIVNENLNRSNATYNSFFKAWSVLLLTSPNTAAIQNLLIHKEYSHFKKSLSPNSMHKAIQDQLFVRGIEVLKLRNIQLEYLCTHLRHYISEKIQEGSFTEELSPLLVALSHQNFLNEYIHPTETNEDKFLDIIEAEISLDLQNCPPNKIALFSTYKPLSYLSNSKDIASLYEKDKTIGTIIKEQILEPANEQEIKKNIRSETNIASDTSKNVQAQYEKNPYPRWRSMTIAKNRPSETQFRGKEFKSILVAGCGTGSYLFELINMYPNAKFTALDFSRSSLAYAVRKSRELGIKNVKFFHADLLELTEHNKQYDLISCTGVLHHLKNPIKGWKTLKKLLKPGGYMNIGLYRHTARNDVRTARKWIQDNNYGVTDIEIKKFREHVKQLPASDTLSNIMSIADFYSLSECRDLTFHVQEHQYTVQRIKDELEELDLRFEFANHPTMKDREQYQDMFPGEFAIASLDHLETYEKKHPQAFIAMYQFWVRKPK